MIFRETREWERKRERETSMWGWNIDWLPPARSVPGMELETKPCALPRLELETFQNTGLCATNWATLHTSQGCEYFLGHSKKLYIPQWAEVPLSFIFLSPDHFYSSAHLNTAIFPDITTVSNFPIANCTDNLSVL